MLEDRSFPGSIPDYLIRFYNNQIAIKNHSENTAYKYTLNVALFMRYLLFTWGAREDIKDVDTVKMEQMAKVSPDVITAYLGYLFRNKWGPSARANVLSSLSAFYEYMLRYEKVGDVNPVKSVERPKLQSVLPRYLSREEAVTLLETVQNSTSGNGVRDYCIITVFLICGIRLDELHKINTDDIHMSSRILTVTGKGNKQREIPVNDIVLGALDDWFAVRAGIRLRYPEENQKEGDKKALFISRQGGKRMSNSAIQKMVKRRFLEAGLDPKKLSAHKLRHTAATLMYESSGDIRSLQEILGHSSLSSTQIYTHVSSRQKADVVNRNPLNIVEGDKPQ